VFARVRSLRHRRGELPDEAYLWQLERLWVVELI